MSCPIQLGPSPIAAFIQLQVCDYLRSKQTLLAIGLPLLHALLTAGYVEHVFKLLLLFLPPLVIVTALVFRLDLFLFSFFFSFQTRHMDIAVHPTFAGFVSQLMSTTYWAAIISQVIFFA